jgi:Sulfotransferase domain
MALRIVGAGVGRTGTASLKLALEQLLGGPCFHMGELFDHPELTPTLQAAARGEQVDWATFPPGYVATVDWPACAFWRELAGANPGAPVLLSTRESSEKWWESYSSTILKAMTAPVPPEDTAWVGRRALMSELMPRFSPDWTTREGAIAGYERHNAAVRDEVPAERLIDWSPGDGWEPICRALGVPVPDDPFPHTNTGAEFRERSDAIE